MRSTRITVIVLLLALFETGCHKRVAVVALPPAPPPAPAVRETPVPPPAPVSVPVPLPVPVPAVPALAAAERAFVVGDYDEAARLYDAYIQGTPGGPQREQALFYLGMTSVLRPSPDWKRGAALFRQLTDEFPGSSFKPAANLILSLHMELDQAATDSKQREQRLKQLTTELERLKKIDADRRKRQ
jgi:hypothetical protein